MQRPLVATRAAAAADLLGRQPLGELAAARLEALGAPRRHAQQARGVAVDKVRVRVGARARARVTARAKARARARARASPRQTLGKP